MYKKLTKNINKRQPLNYSLLTWDRHIHTECGEVKHVSGIKPPNLGQCCNRVSTTEERTVKISWKGLTLLMDTNRNKSNKNTEWNKNLKVPHLILIWEYSQLMAASSKPITTNKINHVYKTKSSCNCKHFFNHGNLKRMTK